jgi:hypothetical protein
MTIAPHFPVGLGGGRHVVLGVQMVLVPSHDSDPGLTLDPRRTLAMIDCLPEEEGEALDPMQTRGL